MSHEEERGDCRFLWIPCERYWASRLRSSYCFSPRHMQERTHWTISHKHFCHHQLQKSVLQAACCEHTVVTLEQLVASQHHVKSTPKELSQEHTVFLSLCQVPTIHFSTLKVSPWKKRDILRFNFQIDHFATQLENTSSLFCFRQYFFRRSLQLCYKYIVVALNQNPVKTVIQLQQEFCSCRAANQYCISHQIPLPFLSQKQ